MSTGAEERVASRAGQLAICALLGFLAAPACAAEHSSHEFRITVEDGVEVALTTGGPKYDGEIFEYELLTVLRPDPEVEESFLYSPQWMTIADDGRIFVGDMGDQQVVVFSPDGDYLDRIGRRGQGPGEFQQLSWVDVVDDVLWVTEWSRAHAFELDGTFIETVSLPQPAVSLIRDGRFWPLPDGRFAIHTLDYRSERYEEGTAAIYVVGADGEVQSSATTPWVALGESAERNDGEQQQLEYQFAGQPWGVFSQELGFVLTYPPEPEILVYDVDGVLRKRYRVERPNEPPTEADRASAIGALRLRLEQFESGEIGSPRSRERNVLASRFALDNLRFAEWKHHFGRPIVDENGFVWSLIPEPFAYGGEHPFHYAIFSPEGEYLGITTPPAFPQPSRGKLLVRNWPDPETGEEYPVVYGIRPIPDDLIY